MKRPGARLRAISARFCSAQTMERVVDPTLADLQTEYEDAARRNGKWERRSILVIGYIAVIRAMTLHGGMCAMWLLRDCTREDRLGLIRTLRASAVIMSVATLVLMIPLLRVVLNGGPHFAELALYVIPQALPLSIPIGLTVGILWGLGRTAASTRSRALIVLIAAMASVASFTVVDWVVPAANQGFRVAMIGHPVPKGANELTLEELRQLLEPTTGEQKPLTTTSDVRSLALNYHGRLALAGAPLVLALFALALTGRRQWGRTIPLLAGCLAIFGYYAVMYSARRLGVDRTLSAFAAAWAPNAAFLVVSVAVMFIRSRPANGSARA